MNWYYVDATGKRGGPVEDAGLDALIAAGDVAAETLVWREGMANWLPLREAKPESAPAAASLTPAPVVGAREVVCAECGGVFPVDDTIPVGNARVCANCKPVFVQKMREGVALAAPSGTLNYAGFWMRFAAIFLDGIILFIINTAINFAFGMGFAGMGARGNAGVVAPALAIALMLLEMGIGAAYEIIMIGKYGATLGKMACKIRVVTPDGAPISYLRSLGRHFAKLISSLICMIGFIMAGFDSEKRALHDRICETRVIVN